MSTIIHAGTEGEWCRNKAMSVHLSVHVVVIDAPWFLDFVHVLADDIVQNRVVVLQFHRDQTESEGL